MKKLSAGLLLYRTTGSEPEVLLVHPGGPFYTKKSEGVWSIPKGEFDVGEDPLEVAKREFKEEIGQLVEGSFHEIEPVTQAGGKKVFAFILKKDLDVSEITSNEFEMEWPPRSGKIEKFPEVDRAEWFTFDKAREMLVKAQAGFIDQLEEIFEDAEQ